MQLKTKRAFKSPVLQVNNTIPPKTLSRKKSEELWKKEILEQMREEQEIRSPYQELRCN